MYWWDPSPSTTRYRAAPRQPGSKRTASGTCSRSYQRLNSASRPASTAARTVRMCSGNTLALLPGARSAPGLAADQVPHAVPVLEAGHRLPHREVARARQADRHLLLDAGRAGGEDDHPVAQVDRLLDVVGHEHDRLPGPLPQPD